MNQRPSWIPTYIPALDGLRGIAIVLVLLHHCQPRLLRLHLGGLAAWGWCGVDLFFVLSGFLITGIVLEGRGQSRFFRNFYARRALRIWPVYALVVPVTIWICGRAQTWTGSGDAWIYFVFFLQNLTPGLAGALYPTWSLAIEEQFYLIWAPLARQIPAAGLAGLLGCILLAEPWIRAHWGALTAVNTLYHLDGLAVGALIALGTRATAWPRRAWTSLAAGAAAIGAIGVPVCASTNAGAWLNTFLALGFGGLLLLAVLGGASGAARFYVRGLSWRPLRFLGRISYGLYLTHMLVFVLLGGVDAHMNRVGAGAGGDLVILILRFSVSIAVATLLWYGFERPILGLKRHFAPASPAVPATAVTG